MTVVSLEMSDEPKMRNAFFVFKKQNVGLLITYSLPLILVFTLVNSELRFFSSDKVTPK